MRAPEPLNPQRPHLTGEQTAALAVGSQVRSIPGHLHHVVGFVDAPAQIQGEYTTRVHDENEGGDRLLLLRCWSERREDWFYVVHRDWEIPIFFTIP